MASLCLNSLPLPPPSQPRKLLETTSLSSLTTNGHAFKPIVVTGNPPSYVSAPGHIDQARCALEIAGVLSSDGQDLWTGGGTVLVQLEDILDRGENEIAILSLLKSLDIQAKAQGDFRYVDPRSFDECSDFLKYMDGYRDDWEEAFADWIGVSQSWKEDRKTSQSYWGHWNLVRVLSFSVNWNYFLNFKLPHNILSGGCYHYDFKPNNKREKMLVELVQLYFLSRSFWQIKLWIHRGNINNSALDELLDLHFRCWILDLYICKIKHHRRNTKFRLVYCLHCTQISWSR
ncbi:hypothetical protein UlMin_013062 [Ulmus minor]